MDSFFAAGQVEVVVAWWLQGASTHYLVLNGAHSPPPPWRPTRVVDVSQPGRGSTSQGALLPQRACGAHRQVAAWLLLAYSRGRHQRGLHQGLLWQGERSPPPLLRSTPPIVVLPVKVFTSDAKLVSTILFVEKAQNLRCGVRNVVCYSNIYCVQQTWPWSHFAQVC